jgi:hypothetical protein
VVDSQSKAQVRRVQLGQSTPSTAAITNGLNEGELVVSEGLQRVRAGATVSAGPASPAPSVSPTIAFGGGGSVQPTGEATKPSPAAPEAKP